MNPLTLRYADEGLEKDFRVAQFSSLFVPFMICLVIFFIVHVTMPLYDAQYTIVSAIYLPAILTLIVGRVWLSYAADQVCPSPLAPRRAPGTRRLARR